MREGVEEGGDREAEVARGIKVLALIGVHTAMELGEGGVACKCEESEASRHAEPIDVQ